MLVGRVCTPAIVCFQERYFASKSEFSDDCVKALVKLNNFFQSPPQLFRFKLCISEVLL